MLNTKKQKKHSGFTLIELLLVISIISLLSSIVLVNVRNAQANARDARRITEIKAIIAAIETYYIDTGEFPPNNPVAQDTSPNNWNVSYFEGFLDSLVPGYLQHMPRDPINRKGTDFTLFGPNPGSYYYTYYHYTAANAVEYGCNFYSEFVVVGIRQLETTARESASKATCGTFPPMGCDIIPSVCRDWSKEFQYSYMIKKD